MGGCTPEPRGKEEVDRGRGRGRGRGTVNAESAQPGCQTVLSYTTATPKKIKGPPETLRTPLKWGVPEVLIQRHGLRHARPRAGGGWGAQAPSPHRP
jgi:hypothetical protein